MKVSMIILSTVLLFAALVVPSTPASAGSVGVCTVNPSPAAVGSVLKSQCFGLIPGAIANIYFVEPDGRAIASRPTLLPLWAVPNNPRADAAGAVSFAIRTSVSPLATAQLGEWTVVATNPGGPNAKGNFSLVGSGVGVSGGSLNVGSVTSSRLEDALMVRFTATGFAPRDVVNGWFDTPLTCSGFGDFAVDHTANHTGIAINANTFGSSWTADASGTIAGSALSPFGGFPACTGTWRFTLHSLGSRIGATSEFVWAGKSVTPTSALLSVTVLGNALYALINIHGAGFPPNTGVNCWSTRPDGRVLPIPFFGFLGGGARTDAGGAFSLTTFADLEYSWSADPGVYSMTCATTDRSALAIARFKINALTIDP